MISNYLVFKLVFTPVLVAAATLAARRWGDSIGGWLIGLPLTSGPVSVFFALEQGRDFAAHAAEGAILGVIASAAFCTAFFLGARGQRWWLSSLAALGGYIPTILFISRLDVSLGWAELLAVLTLIAALVLMAHPGPVAAETALPFWDLPLRMLTATLILVAITTLAASLGPLWSGLLSPFPVFTFVLAIFTQSHSGASSAQRVVKGVVTGLFGYIVFFLIVGLLVTRMNLVLVYGLAALAALSVNAISLLVIVARKRLLAAA